MSSATMILGCPRKLVNGLQMGYNLLINGVYVGYNPFTNLLLTSWDIQDIRSKSLGEIVRHSHQRNGRKPCRHPLQLQELDAIFDAFRVIPSWT